VKLSSPIRLRQQLALELEPGLDIKTTGTGLGLEITGVPAESTVQTSGKEAGEYVAPEALQSKARYKVNLGTLTPYKYHALVELNPALYTNAAAHVAKILEPGECVDLEYYIQPFRNIDLTKLDWHVRIYLID